MTNKEHIESEAKKAFSQLKSKAYGRYNQEAHCLGIIEIMMSEKPFLSEFCKRFYITQRSVQYWMKRHPIFNSCYEYGRQVAHANWLGEAEDMKNNEDFNMAFWKLKGSVLFQLNESRRLKVHIDGADTPMEQYRNIMKAAANGEYTATEIKQIMESINVGIRAYESDTLSKRIDEIEEDAKRMGEHSGTNISTIDEFKKAN